MKEFRYSKAEVKNIPLRTILNRYGVEIRRGNLVLCPQPDHADNDYGSCRIRRDKNAAHCFACNRESDVIRFVQSIFGLEFPEAVEKIGDDFGLQKYETENTKSGRASLTDKEYRFLGFVPAVLKDPYTDEEIERRSLADLFYSTDPPDPEDGKDQRDLHDTLLAARLKYHIESIEQTFHTILNSFDLIQVICGSEIDLGEFPILLERAKRESILNFHRLAEKGFAKPKNNPFISPQQLKQAYEQIEQSEKQPAEVLLRHAG